MFANVTAAEIAIAAKVLNAYYDAACDRMDAMDAKQAALNLPLWAQCGAIRSAISELQNARPELQNGELR